MKRLDVLDDSLTIYAEGGAAATPGSRAATARQPDDGSVTPSADGMEYLLEVAIAQEVVDVWRQWRDGRRPTVDEACDAITYYARNDAYMPVE